MSQHHLCPCSEECSLQAALSAIGGKWKLPILCSLAANGASRYNDLLRNVRGISNTMLSKTLHEMENDGLLRRTEYSCSRPGGIRWTEKRRSCCSRFCSS